MPLETKDLGQWKTLEGLASETVWFALRLMFSSLIWRVKTLRFKQSRRRMMSLLKSLSGLTVFSFRREVACNTSLLADCSSMCAYTVILLMYSVNLRYLSAIYN